MAVSRKIRLSYDASGVHVQGALHPESTIKIDFTDTSASNTNPFDAEVVRLLATQDCFVKFGDMSVAATNADMYFKANQPEYFTLRDQYIAAIRSTVNGSLYVTLMV